MFHVPNQFRILYGSLGSDNSAGNNGMFILTLPRPGLLANTIASDQGGWEHVSVTLRHEDRTPTWEEMCHIKGVFWDEEDCVVQYHPPKEDYVNHHPHCLHLWRPVGIALPMPPSWMVGPKA